MNSVALTRISDVSVDDLTFDDLVRIAREEIPGASQGLWTLHGGVDPGITLLELFAWQLEQRMFSADQLTESTVRAVLRLLDVDDPAPVNPARAVLSFSEPGAVQPLAAGTTVTLADAEHAVPFALISDTWVSPVTSVAVSGELHHAGSELTLTCDRDPARPATDQVALLIDVEPVPGVPAAWLPDAVGVRPPATLRWSAVGPGGSTQALNANDRTGGLRRPGIVDFAWPTVWDEAGSEPARILISVDAGFFTDPVSIRAVYPNAGVAENLVPGVVDVSDQVAAFLPLPGQVIVMPPSVGALTTAPGSVELTIEELDGQTHTWTGVDSWLQIGPADRVFVIEPDRLHFGDGRIGRILRAAPGGAATLRYVTSAGVGGSVAADRDWIVLSDTGAAFNPTPAVGSDREPIAASMERAVDALTAVDRTVTGDDSVSLALATPGVGVARAHALPGFHPDFPCDPVATAITVTVVPPSRRSSRPEFWTPAPQADEGLLSAVTAHVASGRLLGQEIFVLPPSYRAITVWFSIANPVDDHVALKIIEALRVQLDPLNGGSDGNGWPFGGAVRPSTLLDVARATAGRSGQVIDLSVALDDEPASDCDDLAIGERDLVWMEHVHVTTIEDSTASSTAGGLQ